MIWSLPVLVAYLAAVLVLIVLWSLACLLYAGWRNSWPPVGTWLIGLLLIIAAPLIFVVVVRILELSGVGQ